MGVWMLYEEERSIQKWQQEGTDDQISATHKIGEGKVSHQTIFWAHHQKGWPATHPVYLNLDQAAYCPLGMTYAPQCILHHWCHRLVPLCH